MTEFCSPQLRGTWDKSHNAVFTRRFSQSELHHKAPWGIMVPNFALEPWGFHCKVRNPIWCVILNLLIESVSEELGCDFISLCEHDVISCCYPSVQASYEKSCFTHSICLLLLCQVDPTVLHHVLGIQYFELRSACYHIPSFNCPSIAIFRSSGMPFFSRFHLYCDMKLYPPRYM